MGRSKNNHSHDNGKNKPSDSKGKNPSFPFYPGDWMKDPELRSVSAECRGLVMDLLCLMWESPDRGFLVASTGIPFRPEHISRMTGVPVGRVNELLKEIDEVGVFSRDERGALFSRRIVREAQLSRIRAEAGSKGGSKDGANAKQNDSKNDGENIVETQQEPENRGVSGKQTPSKTEANVEANGQAKPKQNSLPSSSSSSSSSSSEIGRGNARAPDLDTDAKRPSLDEANAYAGTIGLPEWRSEDEWLKQQATDPPWKGIGDWTKHWQRVKRWWVRDGSLTHPPTRKGGDHANARASVKPVHGKGF